MEFIFEGLGSLRFLGDAGFFSFASLKGQNDKQEQQQLQEQEQRQMQIQGSLHCGGKSAAFGRDDVCDAAGKDKGKCKNKYRDPGLLSGYDEVEGYGLGEAWVAGGVGGDLVLVGSGWGVAEVGGVGGHSASTSAACGREDGCR